MIAATETRRTTPRWLSIAIGVVAAVGVVLLVLGVLAFLRASDTDEEADAATARAEEATAEADATSAEAEDVRGAAEVLEALGQDLDAQAADLPSTAADVTEAFNVLGDCAANAASPGAFQACFDQHAGALADAVTEEADAVQALRDALAAAQAQVDQPGAPPREGQA